MKQRPTIHDVADKAGVSKSTVSLVLQRSSAVKESTRVAVRKAMSELGYVYNRSAAGLRSSSSGLIGLVINDIRNPFFTEFAASLQEALSDSGFATVLANTNEDPELQSRMVASLIEHGVSAFILSPTYGLEQATIDALDASGTPTLQVFRQLAGTEGRIPFVAPQYSHGGRLATEHLFDVGCQRVAFLGGLEGRPVTHERMKGYLETVIERGCEPVVLTGEATRSFGKRVLPTLRTKHPDVDGVLCFNDLVALGVLSICAEEGLAVGHDLRVVGFDDIEASRESFPPLSSISCDIPNFARETAHQILGWINEGIPPPQSRDSRVRLVVRRSSAP